MGSRDGGEHVFHVLIELNETEACTNRLRSRNATACRQLWISSFKAHQLCPPLGRRGVDLGGADFLHAIVPQRKVKSILGIHSLSGPEWLPRG